MAAVDGYRASGLGTQRVALRRGVAGAVVAEHIRRVHTCRHVLLLMLVDRTSEKPSLRETSVCCGGAPQLVRLIEMRADAMRPYGEWLFRAVTLRFATVAPRFAAVARRRALRILQS